jgi:hypothetical protein
MWVLARAWDVDIKISITPNEATLIEAAGLDAVERGEIGRWEALADDV